MNPTLSNPITGITATPNANVTPAQTASAQSQGFNPVITPTSLAPVNSLVVPPTSNTLPINPPSVAAPLGTTIGSNGIATIPPQTQPTDSAKLSPYKGLLSRLGLANDQLATKGDFTTGLQNTYQLAQKTEQAAKDYNSFVAAKLTQQQGEASIQDNTQGATTSGVTSTLSDFQRKGNANLANLAIIAQASQGLLSAAQQTIKDKVEAQFGPIEDKIKYLTQFAQLNQNDLTDSEKANLQAQIEQKKTESSNLQTALTDIHDRLLQNNAPASVYSTIDRITSDYTSGKISAQDAESKMYGAVGPYGAKNKFTSVNVGYDTNGNPIYSAFDTTTGAYKGGGGSNGGPANGNSTPITTPSSTGATFEQYGLLSHTNFNPDTQQDNNALNYLNVYLTKGQIPTATEVGISSRGPQGTAQFNSTRSRAMNLFFQATGQPLPTPQIVANNIKLINTNNDLANKLTTQEQTVKANVNLSLQNMTKNGLNSSSFAPLNGLIDYVKSAFNDPNVGQFLSQNSTIQNELGSLLAIKNASGTTVYDKLQSAGIINPTDTKEVIQRKVNTLITEAGNFSTALNTVNGELYKKIDPLMINPDNPNRQVELNSSKNQTSLPKEGDIHNENGVIWIVKGNKWVKK